LNKNLLLFLVSDSELEIISFKLFGKEIGNDFFEGKVTLPIILLNQKANVNEKKDIKNCFLRTVIRTFSKLFTNMKKK